MIEHDPLLFEEIYGDTRRHYGASYDALWKGRVETSEYVIRRYPEEVAHFRSSGGVGRGYTDSVHADPIRGILPTDRRLRLLYRLSRSRLGDRIFAQARERCEKNLRIGQKYKDHYYRVRYGDVLRRMLSRLPDVDFLSGGSQDFAVMDGREVSLRHIYTLLRIHDLERTVDLGRVRSLLEVGAGFGANAECILHMYPNIRTYVIVDIPPALYTATLYLRSKFGGRVRDYRDEKGRPGIDLDGDEKTIHLIAPWQVSAVRGRLDLLANLFSFQVFAPEEIDRYARLLQRLRSPATAPEDGPRAWLGGYEVAGTLTRNEIEERFAEALDFVTVDHTEKDTHGSTTWFSLGTPNGDRRTDA